MRRELGLFPNTLDLELTEIIGRAREMGSRLIAVTHKGPSDPEWLEQFDDDSLVVFIVSDETYLPSATAYWLASPKVHSIFTPYPPHDVNLKRWINVAANSVRDVVSSGNLPLFRLWPRTAVAGIIMAKRQRHLLRLQDKLGKVVNTYPLGYTNVFCRSLLAQLGDEEFGTDTSLFKWAESRNWWNLPRSKKLGFAGQKGQMQRQTGVGLLKVSSDSESLVSNNFQGFSGVDEQRRGVRYVQLLLNCSATLNPPGNYSAECFRYVESLIAYCLPIEIDSVLSDPGRRQQGSVNGGMPYFDTWKEAYSWFDQLGEVEVRQNVLNLRKAIQKDLADVREKIRNDLKIEGKPAT